MIEILKDNYGSVQRPVVIALGQLGDKKAIEPLRKLIDQSDTDHYLKNAIKAALLKLEKEEEL